MSRVDDIIATETEDLERAQTPDPLPEHVRVTRGGDTRSQVFSLRLRGDELAELNHVASRRGLPARTLARSWLLDRLHAEQDPAADLSTRVRRLEEAVFSR